MESRQRDEKDIDESGAAEQEKSEALFDSEAGAHRHHHSHSSHHHSHHHHHHKSHSSRKHRKRSNKARNEKLSRFLRHNKKYILYCIIAFAVLGCLIFVGSRIDKMITVDPQGNINSEIDASANNQTPHLKIEVPFFSEDVEIVCPAVEAFYKADNNVPVSEIYDKFKSESARLDIGKPVKLSYEISEAPGGVAVKNAEFLVADNKNFKNPFVINKREYETEAEFYNLKTGTKYFYRINLTFSNGVESSVDGNFTTASGPRVLFVDGVYNIRDVGGWKTVDGREVKQGLLYRGCEIDGAVEKKYTITQSGINTMLTVLGIKTDMDLRSPEDNPYGTDVLGAGVKHIYYTTSMYSGIFATKASAENVRKVFSDLSDKNNYPAYLHCTYGQDRTGTICFLLEALLGVDEESMMKDYRLSGLHHGDVYGGADDMDEFISKLKELPGMSLKEKVEGYLLSIGVTAEEIRSIRNIFLTR